jgi:transposase
VARWWADRWRTHKQIETEMPIDMRSLSREARFSKRVKVVALRRAGRSYVQIALQLGLSRTGVFDICKRFAALGPVALRDTPGGRAPGAGRSLTPAQELLMRRQIRAGTPDELAMPEWLWNRAAVSRLIEQRLGIVLPIRTLALYLKRWGYAASRPTIEAGLPVALRLNAWLTHRYPRVLARSKVEGGEIAWAGGSRLPPETDPGPQAPAPAKALAGRARTGRRGPMMISALTNKGQLRWTTFNAPLDAKTLLAFLRRLVRGANRKVFLIMDDLNVPDERQVQTWLAEHEDAIEAFPLPASRALPAA